MPSKRHFERPKSQMSSPEDVQKKDQNSFPEIKTKISSQKDEEEAKFSTDPASQEPAQPYSSFTPTQKAFIAYAASYSAIFSGLSSFIYYPAITALSRSLKVSIELINLTITSYQVVSGIAPSIIGDMADQTGRRPVSLLAFLLYFAANLGLSLQNGYIALILLRCLQSAGASGKISIAYGIIADIATPAERGSYVGVLMGFTNAAPSLGPILGGLLSEQLSVHWIFYFLTILSAVNLLGLLIFLPETSRKLVGNGNLAPARRINQSLYYICKNSLSRPTQTSLLGPKPSLRCPNPLSCLVLLVRKANFLLLLAGGIQYTVYCCIVASLSTQMIEIYQLTYLTGGLVYLPCGVGGILAAYSTGKLLDYDYRVYARRHKFPEQKSAAHDFHDFPLEKARLRSIFVFLAVSTFATAAYGWSLYAQVHIAVPLITQFFCGSSQVAIFTIYATLLTDLNPNKSATAQASYNLVRCAISACGIAALQAIIEGVGVGWCFTIYAGLGFVCVPICMVLRQQGWSWRKRSNDAENRDSQLVV